MNMNGNPVKTDVEVGRQELGRPNNKNLIRNHFDPFRYRITSGRRVVEAGLKRKKEVKHQI
jgi:hypothetical protein